MPINLVIDPVTLIFLIAFYLIAKQFSSRDRVQHQQAIQGGTINNPEDNRIVFNLNVLPPPSSPPKGLDRE